MGGKDKDDDQSVEGEYEDVEQKDETEGWGSGLSFDCTREV